MKITLEFEHPYELTELLAKLAQCYVIPNPKECSIEKEKPAYTCSMSGMKHDLCDAPECEVYKYE